ncbi:hypothetical protein GCM10017044_17890 [Kordiimonas sediminis]|uniref:Cytochrome c domain-containing protein n=1 Tax=Kordiimonas sediminis TaxID=1735581 RepID=A0A919E6C2_9PROT|nr:PQQ-dependent sugar dehydrogenase [Kordiimonas sediminis]GHF23744.1 hypothetical protein GCM10017044_17890 [Kordiimonas sediminis]
MVVKGIVSAVMLAAVSFSAQAQLRIGQGPVAETYKDFCASCHGDNMQGGSGPSLIDDESLHGNTPADLTRIIAKGVPDTEMMAFEDGLSAEDIRALVIYISENKRLAEIGGLESIKRPANSEFSTEAHSFKLETLFETEGVLWAINFLPNQDMLVTRRDGTLFVIRDGKATVIEGTPEVWHKRQGGLLDAEPHPDYENNGWIYLSFSASSVERDGNMTGMTKVVRGKIKDNKWTDEETIFLAPTDLHIATNHHFGSRFVFDDGYLYFSIGDRGRMEMAQDLARPNGKIHRIHDDGRIPADNPFVDTPGAMKSVWSYGHRNPQGLMMDTTTGLLYDTEHGPRGGDELNLIEKGKNYGWPVITYGMNYNGTPMTDKTEAPGMEQPVIYWVPSIATAGSDFYDGDKFPSWKGDALVAGMASQELHRVRIKDGKALEDEVILRGMGRIRDVETGPDGYIYVLLNDGNTDKGTIARLVPVSD